MYSSRSLYVRTLETPLREGASSKLALKARIGRLSQPAKAADWAVIPFGIGAVDTRLPRGGPALGALHEVSGCGPDVEHGTSAALLLGGVLARHPGQVLWVVDRGDLFAPALGAVGLSPDRVIYAEAGRAKTVLMAMEEGLRHAGLAGVVGELSGTLLLIASRRLQLAAEQSGVICFALRRSRNHDDPALAEPTAAMTRWRVSALPSPPPLPYAPHTPGVARARWRLELLRCRGGEPATWIVEASDATGHLDLPADLADHWLWRHNAVTTAERSEQHDERPSNRHQARGSRLFRS